MVCNGPITIYHKGINQETKLETWTRFNYTDAWSFRKQRANITDGYSDTNAIEIRLPYTETNNLDNNNFSIGDIIAIGNITDDIETQNDLINYEIYNIISISDNKFGASQHIHISGV